MAIPDNFRPKSPVKNNKNFLNGAWIFAAAACTAIIIACLVPLITGKSPLDLILETKPDKPQISSTELGSNQRAEQTAEAKGSKSEDPLENKADVEPLELVTVKERSLKADSYHGDAQNPKLDEGDLPENLPLGIEASTPEATTRNRITLRGDTLERIEDKSMENMSQDSKSSK